MSDRTDWTRQLDDAMLNDVLFALTKAEYRRALVRVANQHAIGQCESHGGFEKQRDGDPVQRRLWGLATRSVEYVPTVNRISRVGLPWTFAELSILKWAFVTPVSKQAKDNLAPDNDYIAWLLCRTVDEIREKRGITKPGVKGFGIL